MEKIIKPSYFEKFNCIGGDCEDTCCAGWYIAIDEKTYKKYKKVKEAPIRARLNKELVEKKNGTTDHVAKIKLKNGRCAFLNKEGWCDIYTCLGESYLSDTCTLYPRAINKINDQLEYTLIMSCPEAARKILLNKEPIKFEESMEASDRITISGDIKVSSKKATKWQDYFLEIRALLITILQNRSIQIEERLGIIGTLLGEINILAQKGEYKKIETVIAKSNQELGKIVGENLEKEADIAAKLVVYLRYFSNEKKLQSRRYIECLEEVFRGLQVKDELVLQDVHKAYKEGYKKYYKPFLEEKGYIIENYLVNYTFERCIPLDANMPLESFLKLQLYYRLIRLQLIAIANVNNGLSDEAVVKLVQSFTKTFDHNSEYIEELIEYMRYNG